MKIVKTPSSGKQRFRRRDFKLNKIHLTSLTVFMIFLSVSAMYASAKESLFSLNLQNKSIEKGFFELGCLSGSKIQVIGQDSDYNFTDKEINNLSLDDSIKYMLSDFNYIILYGSEPTGEPAFDIFIFSKKSVADSAMTAMNKSRGHQSSEIKDTVSNSENLSAGVSESTSDVVPLFSSVSSGVSENDLNKIPAEYNDLTIVPPDSLSEGLTVGDIKSHGGLSKKPMLSDAADLPISPIKDNTGVSIASSVANQGAMQLQAPQIPLQIKLMPPDSGNAGLTMEGFEKERSRNIPLSQKPFVAKQAFPISPLNRNDGTGNIN